MLRCIILTVLIAGSFGGAMSEDAEMMPTPRNVNVTKTDIKKYPHQLSVQLHLCGASIISDKWAVTAAHCTGTHPGSYRLRAGNNDRDLGTLYTIRNIIPHPKYNISTFDYDIALLEIDGTFEFNDNVQPIPLAENELSGGTEVTVTGWGGTSEDGPPYQNLMQLPLPIVDRSACQSSYDELNDTVTERMICAGYTEGSENACFGDSGGPLSTNGTLYGVVSWGRGCGYPNLPGIYSNVANVRQWILETTGI